MAKRIEHGEYTEQRLREEHLTMVNRIYELCDTIEQLFKKLEFAFKVIIYGTLFGMFFGALLAFTVFFWLYNKGIIQRWF